MSRLTKFLMFAAVLSAPLVGALAPASARALASVRATGPTPGLPMAIFSTIPGASSWDVPGVEDAHFTSLYAPSGSPNGVHWILRALYEAESVTYDAIITGSGMVSTQDVALVSGELVAAGETTYRYISFRTWLGINDQGEYAFSGKTDAPSTADDVVMRSGEGGAELLAREGLPAPGQLAGVGFGATNDAVALLNNGAVTFRSASLTGDPSQQVLYCSQSLDSAVIVAQTDVTAPVGQRVVPTQTLDYIYEGSFRTDAAGVHFIYYGNLNGPYATDDVIVVDGRVRAQEGARLPGSSFTLPVAALHSMGLAAPAIAPANGHYLFRGSNADGTDWVVRDGAVAAISGAPIVPAASEVWGGSAYPATFFLNVTNSRGDFVIGGATLDGATEGAALVLNNSQVVLRAGDPVDLNGNGLADDGARISAFLSDYATLTDELVLYFVADLEDEDGEYLGEAFLVVPLLHTVYTPMALIS